MNKKTVAPVVLFFAIFAVSAITLLSQDRWRIASPTEASSDPQDPAAGSILPVIFRAVAQGADTINPEVLNEAFLTGVRCQFVAGTGSSEGLGVLLADSGQGSLLFIVGAEGVVESQILEFIPNHVRFTARPDGTVVLGVGDLRVNSKAGRELGAPEPLKFFHGESVIFSTEKAVDFGIASNGSSFFVVESTVGANSRLIMRHIDDAKAAVLPST